MLRLAPQCNAFTSNTVTNKSTHTHIHTYIHVYIHNYIHTYIHTALLLPDSIHQSTVVYVVASILTQPHVCWHTVTHVSLETLRIVHIHSDPPSVRGEREKVKERESIK